MTKFDCELLVKEEIRLQTFILLYGLNENLDYIPGQFVRLEFAPKQARAYSIIDISKKTPKEYEEKMINKEFKSYLTLLISTTPGGIASQYFDVTKIKDKLTGMGSLGKFQLKESSNEKVFIATGTGLAPFIPMIKTLTKKGFNNKIKLFFGTKKKDDNIIPHLLDKEILENPKFEHYICCSKEESLKEENNIKIGRVTEVLPNTISNYQNCDFYICGNPLMVDEIETILKQKDAENIFAEKYGVAKKPNNSY